MTRLSSRGQDWTGSPRPWHVGIGYYHGYDTNIVDVEGHLVAECDGPPELGERNARAICAAVNGTVEAIGDRAADLTPVGPSKGL